MLRLLGRGPHRSGGRSGGGDGKGSWLPEYLGGFYAGDAGQTPQKAARLAEYGLSLAVLLFLLSVEN